MSKRIPAEHPAPFSEVVLDTMRPLVDPGWGTVIDPFAGVGLVHRLTSRAIGVELEPEWACAHPRTICGNALSLPFADGVFGAAITSPCYGTRMADHHNARDSCKTCKGEKVVGARRCRVCRGTGLSRRNTYRHRLGRELHPDNAGQLQWGEPYREFHRQAWAELIRVLRPPQSGTYTGAPILLNISDHYRQKVLQPVTEFHITAFGELGYAPVKWLHANTPRYKNGANRESRADHESVILLHAM